MRNPNLVSDLKSDLDTKNYDVVSMSLTDGQSSCTPRLSSPRSLIDCSSAHMTWSTNPLSPPPMCCKYMLAHLLLVMDSQILCTLLVVPTARRTLPSARRVNTAGNQTRDLGVINTLFCHYVHRLCRWCSRMTEYL